MDKAQAGSVHRVLGVYFRQQRHTVGLTQEKVAIAIGVDPSHYRRLESGQKKVSLIRLIEICKVLEIDPGTLVSKLNQGLPS